MTTMQNVFNHFTYTRPISFLNDCYLWLLPPTAVKWTMVTKVSITQNHFLITG